MSIGGGSIDISCRCWATCARRASRRPLNKFIEDVATGKSAKVERTDKECGKSIMRGGLAKDYTRQKRKPSTSPTGKDPLRPLGVPPKPCRDILHGGKCVFGSLTVGHEAGKIGHERNEAAALVLRQRLDDNGAIAAWIDEARAIGR